MTAAKRYAEGGGRSTEINLLNAIERFGVEAVMGRPVLYAKEIRRMVLAERVVRVIQTAAHAEDWAKWTREHPDDAELYNLLMKDDDNG